VSKASEKKQADLYDPPTINSLPVSPKTMIGAMAGLPLLGSASEVGGVYTLRRICDRCITERRSLLI